MFFGILFAGITYFMVRIILIVIGVFKGPVLAASHRYGDAERLFEALPQLLLWTGLWSVGAGVMVTVVAPNAFFPFQTFGTILLLGALFTRAYPQVGLRYFRYPRWYFRLLENTSRYERRRIAYMWLKLSPKLRRVYNSNTHAFREWADFVILSTIF